MSPSELDAIRAAAAAANLSVGRFVVERARDQRPSPALVQQERMAIRRQLRELDVSDTDLLERVLRRLEELES